MKRSFLLILFSAISLLSFAQLNMTYVGNIQYDQELSDVWGYAAPDGTEYALVGVFNGVSIVSLADPANPVEVDFVPGANSTWRDIKVWGDHAYVINESGGGLLVIDLSNLPNEVDAYNWAPSITGLGTLNSCHNLWIDEFGYAYLVGCNINAGGLLYVDVATAPGVPLFEGAGAPAYSHDVYVRDNRAYSAEINAGVFSAYDVSDKDNTLFLASHPTPFSATHNLWLSDDSSVLFTTDETSNGPVAAYDVSDLDNIVELDQFRPLETLGAGVIPHNVHVWNDFLIISYYTDGCILVDAARPSNLVEVGNFDTFIPTGTGFSGAWGAYPFLPSGLVLVSDIESGLYILEPNYVRACYLEGEVTDAVTGAKLAAATVNILGDNAMGETGLAGNFATGIATAGTYEVQVKKAGYYATTVEVDLLNGEVTELQVALEPLPSFTFSGQVNDAETGEPVSNAKVLISNDDFEFSRTTNQNGQFAINTFYLGNYEVIAGQWGYLSNYVASVDFDEANNSIEIELEAGIEDIFSLDLGWELTSSAIQGNFELGDPVGVAPPELGYFLQPEDDVAEDVGNSCYVTGNIADLFNGVQIQGTTRIESPLFDLSTMNDPRISFYTWIFTANIQGNPAPGDDDLIVMLSNGTETQVIGNYSFANILFAPDWAFNEIIVADTITPTDSMRLIVEIGDSDPGFTDVAEAGFDFFRAFDADPPSNTNEVVENGIALNLYPNPAAGAFTVDYRIEDWRGDATLLVNNMLGQLVASEKITDRVGNLTLGADLSPGIYFIRIAAGDTASPAIRLIKQ